MKIVYGAERARGREGVVEGYGGQGRGRGGKR